MTDELEMAARQHDFALGELANSRPAAAVRALKQALALDPKRVSAHHDLGLALKDLGRLEEAERAHRDALSLDPSHAAAHLSLGELLQGRGALAEARSCFESALRLTRSPAPASIYMQLGGVLWKLGDSMRALEAFERAVAGAPGSAEAHYNLGSAQLELGRFDAAEHSAREVLRLRPGFSEALMLRAAAVAATGSVDAAVELLRTPGGQDATAAQHQGPATAQHQGPAAAQRMALAIRLLNSRLFEPARRCLEAALREDPTEPMANHLLSALSGTHPDHPIEGYVRQLFDASAATFDLSHLLPALLPRAKRLDTEGKRQAYPTLAYEQNWAADLDNGQPDAASQLFGF